MDGGCKSVVNFVVEEDPDTGVRRVVCSLWGIFTIRQKNLRVSPLLMGLLLEAVLYRASEKSRHYMLIFYL